MNVRSVALNCIALLLISPLVAAQQAGTRSLVRVAYDRIENSTTVTLEPMVLSTNNKTALSLMVSSFYRGRSLAPLEGIELHFLSSAPRPRFQNNSRLTLLVNGESLRLGETKIRTLNVKSGVFNEDAFTPIDLETFVMIARASSVEGRIGEAEFKLSAVHLSTLRSMVEEYSTSAKVIDEIKQKIQEIVEKLTRDLEENKRQTEDLVNLERLTRAERRLESLRSQLIDVQSKKADGQAKLEQIDHTLQSKNLDGQWFRSQEERERRRGELANEKSRILAMLHLLEESRTRLEANIADEEAAVSRLRSQSQTPTRPLKR